ncbi:hypothetical protein M3G50_12860 [Brachybacterium muris]|uniref:hypothetical protein n=1 Tax=Brachybacterium muris TaxID=219301 RepID=UPI0021A27877|nr:hypothetical protein [Brachybacterium muris]MCT1431627.1 hypothetical protein [Brachybacterium muris]
MAELKIIAVSDLRLDQRNARFSFETTTQQMAMDALARDQGRRLVSLAVSIQEEGLDPSQQLMVTPSVGFPGRYDVLEGNRRVLALKALETPTLIEAALTTSEFRKLKKSAEKYRSAAIIEVPCIVYIEEELDVANLRIRRRHGGEQDGAGLVTWGTAEKERHALRYGSGQPPSFAAQAIEFLERIEGQQLPPGAKIRTTLDRILTSPEVQEKLGIKRNRGLLQTNYPPDVVAKSLRYIVDDLLAEDGTKVSDVYHAEDRRNYAAGLPDHVDPADPNKSIDAVPISELNRPSLDTKRSESAPTLAVPHSPQTRPKRQRSAVAARSAVLNRASGRSGQIYGELATLDAEKYANAGAVLLRVFVEISVDHYIDAHPEVGLDSDKKLALKMKKTADHLRDNGGVSEQQKKAIHNAADSKHGISPSVFTLHQFVHNEFTFPKAFDIQRAWDELQFFLEAIWK